MLIPYICASVMKDAYKVQSFTAPHIFNIGYTCERKLNCWFYSAVIFRGMGLNFGNDPFATVGEEIRMKRRRKSLKDRTKGWK